jgi:hypothetical protein
VQVALVHLKQVQLMEATLLLVHLLLLHQLEAGKAALTLVQELLVVLAVAEAVVLAQVRLEILQTYHLLEVTALLLFHIKVLLEEMVAVRHLEVLVGVAVLER